MEVKKYVITAVLLTACLSAWAQEDALSAFDALIVGREAAADTLRREFRFREAIAEYEALLPLTEYSNREAAIRRKISETRRGVIMMDLCRNPEVIAKRRFPLKDFLLFYPFKNGSWRPSPNTFDPFAAEAFAQATYAPKGLRGLYYSAPDGSGCRNIYYSEDRDTVWSAPILLGESLVSAGDEIYPMLSPDGKTLYFASDGLYGMGGFDLYKSVYDEETESWGAPVNMGFPYSSPADDFLFIGTEDGKYAIFASNRECARDSVCLYVLDFKTLDREIKVSTEDELRLLSRLTPAQDLTRMDNDSMVDRGRSSTDGTIAYREQMNVVRRLKDKIYRYEKAIDDLKLQVTSLQEAAVVKDSVAALEAALPILRDSLAAENEKVHAIESEFLRSGVVSGSGTRSSDREVVGAASAYTFTKHSYGSKLKVNLETPDYSRSEFSVSPIGRFSLNFPKGEVYQIQFMTSFYHATLEDIRGLTPVFERLTPDLKYTYTTGVFYSYQAALAALNSVRRLGFSDCRIIRFIDGKEADIAKNIVNQ